jgi:hypothetical protein
MVIKTPFPSGRFLLLFLPHYKNYSKIDASIIKEAPMDVIYIRRSQSGKTFVASAAPDFPGLADRKCPFTGEAYESQVKDVNADKSEIMGIDFDQAVTGVKKDGLYFGRFRVNLGDTLVIS